MASQTTTTTVQPALLFMPDISGFTEFVNNLEITHAQSIIQELLEIIIDSNQIGLEVSEIEGDAIFFYRIGKPPGIDELLQQVQTMFTRFHHHLDLYNHQRICPCGACTAASNLTLKVVAHFGEVAGFSLKQQRKLFGKDIIILHRLLKNSLNKREYALFTHTLMREAGELQRVPEWYDTVDSVEQYDVGELAVTVVDLGKLRSMLPMPQTPAFHLSDKTKIVFSEARVIPAPSIHILLLILELSQRTKWMDGLKDIELLSNNLINRVGTKHKCILNTNRNPVIDTEYANLGDKEFELIEMDDNGMGGCRYLIHCLSEYESNLTMEFLVNKNPFILAMFHLFMKDKMQKSIRRSIDNLDEFCRSRLN